MAMGPCSNNLAVSCRPPVVGVLGCMAERLKVKLLDSDKLVDLVAGPDAYRDIPRLLDTIEVGSLLIECIYGLKPLQNLLPYRYRAAAAIQD